MKLKKLDKKGNGFLDNNFGIFLAGLALLLTIGMLIVFHHIFLSQILNSDIVYAENGGNHSLPTNTTIAIGELREGPNIIAGMMEFAIMVLIMGAAVISAYALYTKFKSIGK